jgi:diacylglycerol kinase (ATP)
MKQWKNGNLISKTGYSLNGIWSAFKSEKAVRREFGALAFLINTSCETMIDMLLGPIYREDVRHAKDMLSGAVLISLFCGYTAALILIFG